MSDMRGKELRPLSEEKRWQKSYVEKGSWHTTRADIRLTSYVQGCSNTASLINGTSCCSIGQSLDRERITNQREEPNLQVPCATYPTRKVGAKTVSKVLDMDCGLHSMCLS